MGKFKFGACEWAFPAWGSTAVQMAHEAGFDGIQLGDAGACMHAHPLRDKRVQDYYLNAGAKYNIEFPQIHLYTLGHLCYYRNPLDTVEGKICLEIIKNAVIAASEMGVPSVIIDAMKLNNPAKKQHALDVAKYAVKVGAEYGVNIGVECDFTLEGHFKFLDEVGGGLRLCFDTHNPCMYGTGYPPDMIRALGKDRMDHFHIKDNAGDENGLVTYETPLVPFGTGVTYFRETAEAVKEIGFEGWIIAENMYYQPGVRQGSNYVEAAKRDVQALHDAYGYL